MKRLFVLLILMTAGAQARASDRVSELERKLESLSQEVERLKLGGAGRAAERTLGSKLALGGYMEINAQNFARRDEKGDPAGKRSASDAQRLVLVGDYAYDESISFRFELEFEHGGTGEGAEERGEAGIEQAFIDFRHSDPLRARIGHILVPMGLVNVSHEPPAFHGVRRPSVEELIVPSTWHENGLGLLGRAGPLSYETYLVAGLEAVGSPSGEGFTGSEGIRGGRSEGSHSSIEDRAWVSRLDLRPVPGVLAGGSIYIGEADQNITASAVPVTLWEAHASAEYAGAELRALYAEGRIGNADAVNAAQAGRDPAFSDFVGRRLFGGYAQAAFNALSLRPETKQYLAPFVRYERYDTQSRVPDGSPNDAANSRVEYTLGLTYKPIPAVALKLDRQWLRNQARTGVNQWDFGIGLIF